jgi:hypothetical protein
VKYDISLSYYLRALTYCYFRRFPKFLEIMTCFFFSRIDIVIITKSSLHLNLIWKTLIKTDVILRVKIIKKDDLLIISQQNYDDNLLESLVILTLILWVSLRIQVCISTIRPNFWIYFLSYITSHFIKIICPKL